MEARLIKTIRDSWELLAQFSVWIIGVIALFMVNPPELWEGSGPDTTVEFTYFVAAVVSGLMLVAVLRWRSRRHLKAWVFATVATLSIGAALFFFYRHAYISWTCRYTDVAPLKIIGLHMKPSEIDWLRDHPDFTCMELIQSHAGVTRNIWPASEIEERYFIIVFVFVSATMLFCAAIVALIQSFRCARSRK